MRSPPTIAVAHYPEGAGHATRMLAIANALQSGGADVRMAGGGAGTEFVALNGYDEFEPTTVDYIDTYQGGSLRNVFAESVPATAARVTDYVEWLRDLDPDALVTDDMFAAIASTRTDVPLYVLKHDVPAMYHNRLERAGASFHTSFQLSVAREFFYPTVWPKSAADPAGVTRVPPVALDGADREGPAPDVVVVPSHYSELGRIADQLTRLGYDVLDVGSDDWEPVASLLPCLRAADVVVCSGYSTVMDAAVAGTPCIVHPATDEQEAVADWLERFDVSGFAIAPEPLDVLEAIASPPDSPAFENGASVIAETVLDDLSGESDAGTVSPNSDSMHADGAATTVEQPAASDSSEDTVVGSARVRVGRARRLTADRIVAGMTALGTGLQATTLRIRALATVARRRALAAGTTLRRLAIRAWRFSSTRVGAVVAMLINVGKTIVRRCRRYRIATGALSVATVIVVKSGVWRKATRLVSRLRAGPKDLREVAGSALNFVTDGVDRIAGSATSNAHRLKSLAHRFRDYRRSLE